MMYLDNGAFLSLIFHDFKYDCIGYQLSIREFRLYLMSQGTSSRNNSFNMIWAITTLISVDKCRRGAKNYINTSPAASLLSRTFTSLCWSRANYVSTSIQTAWSQNCDRKSSGFLNLISEICLTTVSVTAINPVRDFTHSSALSDCHHEMGAILVFLNFIFKFSVCCGSMVRLINNEATTCVQYLRRICSDSTLLFNGWQKAGISVAGNW